ncbi:MAG: DUF87 domain-containing protein, partial [Actinobacteria bacterium]|nr:DUF87 domain-containing protein [Actinomycetota bacterium]
PGATLLAILHHSREWAISYGPPTIAVLIAGVGALMGIRWWWARRRHAQFLHHARLITVLAPPCVDPAGGQALWSNLVGLLRPEWRRWLAGQPHLGFEYGFSDTGITLRLWVPGVIPPGLVERAIEAAWPGAHTHTTTASPPIPHPQVGQQRLVVSGELRLARPEALPIRTDFDADPLRAALGAPVGLGRGQYACMQILARPATGRRLARARYAARRLHTGGSTHLISRLLDLITPGMTIRRPTANSGRANGDPQRSLEYSAQNRAIITKQRGSQCETVIRYAVTTLLPTGAGDQKLRAARQLARGRAHALAAAFACYTEHNHYTRHRIRRPATVLTERQFRHGDLLSVPELAAVAHLPTDAAIPGLQRAGARAIAPPPGIASPGPDAKPIGITDTGHPRPVALRVPDARHHLHVLGATGSGKSTLLAAMALADVDAGRGIVLIDPKGDLVTDLLSRLPRSASDRLVLFDAHGRTRPPCLNPLDGEDTDLVVDNLVSVFRRVYSAFWGPRTDDL